MTTYWLEGVCEKQTIEEQSHKDWKRVTAAEDKHDADWLS